MLTLVQQYKYGTPVFIVPKKEGTMRSITDYFRLNRQLVRNQYSLTIIGKTIHQMEGLQYKTTLDLNMGNYTI